MRYRQLNALILTMFNVHARRVHRHMQTRYRLSAIGLSAIFTVAVITTTLVAAQNVDCAVRQCLHLPLISKSLPEPTPEPEPPGIEVPNGGFEQGPTVWAFGVGATAQQEPQLARRGNWSGVLINGATTSTIQQSVSIPVNAEYLVIWYTATSTESDCTQNLGTVEFDNNPADDVEPEIYATIQEFCAAKQFTTYKQKRIYIEPLAGQQISLIFALDSFGTAPVIWRLDDLQWQLVS